jgi:heptaprenyl diphosphate synthase component 2
LSKPLFSANLNPELSELLESVRNKIVSLVQESPDMIREDLEILTARPGKMLRPLFLLISAQGGDADQENLISVAAAVELLHIASLAHDDVLDNAARRRGVATLYQRKGAKRAILAGDYLLAMSMKMASSHFEESLVPHMTGGIERLCLSEIEQDENLGSFEISREDYFRRIRGKTAELFALSLYAGALLSGKTESQREILYNAGIDFGTAFQIQDDILDYRGNPGTMGKSRSTDLKNGIPTLPLILALEDGVPLIRFLLNKFMRPLFSGILRKQILQRAYDHKAQDIADKYFQSSLESASKVMSQDGFEQYSLLLGSLGSRIH